MMTRATDPDPLAAGEGTTVDDEGDAVVDEAGSVAGVNRLAALARLDLDAATLEMVMAALAVDVCDQIDAADA